MKLQENPEKEVNTGFPAFNPEQWRDFVEGKEVGFFLGEKPYQLSLQASGGEKAKTALLSNEYGVALGELDINLPDGNWSLGHSYGKSMNVLEQTLNYLNKEKSEFFHQMEIQNTKEKTGDEIEETLEESN